MKNSKRILACMISMIFVSIILMQAEVITIKTESKFVNESEYDYEIKDTAHLVRKLDFKYSNLQDSLTMILNEFVSKKPEIEMYLFSVFEKSDSTIVIEIVNWDYWSGFRIPADYNEKIDEIGMAKYYDGRSNSADFYVISDKKQQSKQIIRDFFQESGDTLNYKRNIIVSQERIYHATEEMYNLCQCYYKSEEIEIIRLMIAMKTIVNI